MYIKCSVKFFDRFLGLMFRFKKIDYGICFPNCNSIHTFFMFQNIDVIMTDKNHNIIKYYPNLKPWRIILPKKNVYYVYELPLGSIDKINVNDKFKKVEI